MSSLVSFMKLNKKEMMKHIQLLERANCELKEMLRVGFEESGWSFEVLENTEQHIEVLDSHKVNGKEDPLSRDYYVCDDGVFCHEGGID